MSPSSSLPLAAALAAAVWAPGAAADALALAVDLGSGGFRISHGGRPWLAGGEYRVGTLSSSLGGLVLAGVRGSEGADALGAYRATTLEWAARAAPGEVLMHAGFREYVADAGLLVFEQRFPSEVPLAALVGSSGLLAGTLFPGFSRGGPGTAAELPCFAYHNTFPRARSCTLGTYEGSRQGGVPLVVYNATSGDLPMVVFSPLSSPMAHQMAQDGSFFGPGVKATVEVIPAGWSQLFLLSAGAGINSGMMAWGDRMLRYTGRARVDNRYRDDVHGGIGFWTDNGGYYHYSLGDNQSLGTNYEEVLPKVKAYHESIGVRFRHWQFDSWFYPKEGFEASGSGGPVTNWTANASIFPHGMAYIQAQLKVPLVMHNRQWSTRSDYIRNWPDVEWYTAGTAAVPKDPHQFFRRFFQQQEGWGLSMYEQDWMSTQYDSATALQTNISLGDLWLRGMAEGAEAAGRTIQYCMPYPNEVLSAAAYPAVTNVRTTGDYLHDAEGDQWAFGNTALFYWALNILPFKDGFYSSSRRQTGGATVGPEPHPDREALMATLSCAMVAPMDGIYLLNASRVLATCRKDGVVLKPDRPATTTDACFRTASPACHVYHTYSDVAALGRVHYYYNDDGTAPLLAEEVYLGGPAGGGEHAVYNWYTGALTRLEASNTLAAGYEGHIYAVVTPVVSGWAFLGEVGVYVPASTLRFPSVAATGELLVAQVHGVAGEAIRVCAARALGWAVTCKVAAFDREETKPLTFEAGVRPVTVAV